MTHADAAAAALGLPGLPECFSGLWEAAQARAAREDLFSDAWMTALEEKQRIFSKSFDLLRRAAGELRANAPLRDFTLLLSEALRDRGGFREWFPALTLPAAPAGAAPLAYDLASLLAMLPLIPDARARFRARGVPEDIIAATLDNFEECIFVFESRFGRPGYDKTYLSWCQHHLDALIVRLGRLNFEARPAMGGVTAVYRRGDGALTLLAVEGRFHRDGILLGNPGSEEESGAFDADFIETDECAEGFMIDPALGRVGRERVRLLRGVWEKVLTPRDPVISVHIPAGPGLTPEACAAAYAQAREIFPRCYPDQGCRAFYCGSWLLDPQLAQILRPDANIVRFQQPFLRCPSRFNGRAVFSFVFLKPVERLADLPENTTLERALKRHYMDGGLIHELGGVFF